MRTILLVQNFWTNRISRLGERINRAIIDLLKIMIASAKQSNSTRQIFLKKKKKEENNNNNNVISRVERCFGSQVRNEV